MMTSEEIVVDLNVRELIDWMLRELESDNAEIKDIQEASPARATKKQSEKSSKMTKKTTKTTTTTTTDAATAKTSTATTTTTTTTHKDETPADVSNRRVSLRVRNTNVQQQQQQQQQEQSTAASVPANKRKLSDVLGQLAGAGGEKKQRRNTTKNPDTAATDENSSNSASKRSLPAKRKLVEVEDKENVPPGHSVHKAARSGAAKRTIKSPPQKENAFEKILEEVSDTETTTTTTATNTKTDIEVATFMAQCAALRKLNQCVSLNGGQIVLNQTASSSTEASVTAIIGDNLNHIIASTEQQQQQQPLLPEFQTVVDGGASHAMFSDETVEQIFKNALLENTNDNNRSINQIGVNYLASDTPFFYGHEYEVYTDGTGSNVCQLVEQKVTTVSKQSETAISFTIGESSATATAAAETTSKTNVTEEDEAKPSSSSRHEEESVTNESNEGSQSEGYNLKLPENYTPESFDFNGIDLVAIEGKNLCTYAANVAKAIFTLDELSNGYIQEGLTSRKSTKKQHLDHFRVKILKDAICNRFNITEDRLDSLWKKIRHSLNLRFARIGPSLQKKSQKSE